MDPTLFINLSAQESRFPSTVTSVPNHATITWEKRTKVLEWVAKIHGRFSLQSEVLWLAANIFHRYISSGAGPTISPYHSGLTSLWVATKLEGHDRAHDYKLRHFARSIDNRGRTRRRMIEEEARILATLNYRLGGYVSPTFWVGHIAVVSGFEPFSLRIALVMVDTTVTQPCFSAWFPKELASVAVLIARKIWRQQPWSPAFVSASGFSEQELKDRANLLLSFLRSNDYVQSYMYRKYFVEAHHSISGLIRIWALDNTEI